MKFLENWPIEKLNTNPELVLFHFFRFIKYRIYDNNNNDYYICNINVIYILYIYILYTLAFYFVNK